MPLVGLIGATTTQGGLQVRAERDTSTYPTKVSVPETALAALALTRHAFHGEWNYTSHPQPCQVYTLFRYQPLL